MTVVQSLRKFQNEELRTEPHEVKHPTLLALLIAAVFFAAIAPTLTWIEFSGGMENFNLETALEMTRDGHWLLPTLDGQPRTKKPPLATWITALGILSSNNTAWAARWPSLLMASLTLLLVYDMGRLVGGARLGLVAACIAGGSLIVLQFARQASYDTQFAFWVMLTNVFIARIVLRGQWWVGCIGAGAAMGLALMTKGPPALLLTFVPPVVLVVLDWIRDRKVGRALPAAETQSGGQCPPYAIILGVLICLAIALPWTIYVMRVHPGRVTEWYEEVTLATEARFEHRFGRWFSYLTFIGWVVPWTVGFIGAMWVSAAQWWKRSEPASVGTAKSVGLVLAWVVVPLLIMSFFPERRERYALPIVGPAAVLVGWVLLEYLAWFGRAAPEELTGLAKVPLALHWAIVFLLAIGLPVVGAMGIKGVRTVEGRQWFSPGIAAAGAAVAMAVALAMFRWRRPTALSISVGGFAVMLVIQFIGVYGYAKSPDGRSEARPLVRAVLDEYPDAIVYNAVNRSRRRDLPLEMTIYFNRVVPRAEDVSKLSPGDRPQVIVFPDGAEHPPAGFRRVARHYIKQEWWNAYVLPAKERG